MTAEQYQEAQHQLSLLDQIRAQELAQLERLTAEQYPPAQRHSATSRAAAKAIAPEAGTLRDRVYRCIKNCGPITDEEIAITLGLNPSTARPRRVELVASGLVRAWHEPARTKAGRIATAWVVVVPNDF